MISAYVGVFLRSIRKLRGLTLTRVSEATKIHLGVVSRIERGTYKPTLEQLAELCAVYRFKVSELVELASVAQETPMFEAAESLGRPELLDYLKPNSKIVDYIG